MSDFTSGPWKELTDDNGDIWVIADDAHQYHIANMEGSCGVCHANAHLIAAAPTLLEACEAALAEWETYPLSSSMGMQLRDAIAKAKGVVSE